MYNILFFYSVSYICKYIIYFTIFYLYFHEIFFFIKILFLVRKGVNKKNTPQNRFFGDRCGELTLNFWIFTMEISEIIKYMHFGFGVPPLWVLHHKHITVFFFTLYKGWTWKNNQNTNVSTIPHWIMFSKVVMRIFKC